MQPPQYNYGPPPPPGYNQNYARPPMGPPSQSGQSNPGPSSYPGYQQPFPGAYQQQPGQQMPHVSSFPGQNLAQSYSPSPQPFMPTQNYQQNYQQYSGPPSYTQPPSTGASQIPAAAAAMPGAGFMGGLSPMTLMTGGFLSAPQHFMQQRLTSLKTNMTGGTMNALFNISNKYVKNKLMMLLMPYLSKWTFQRMHEQIAGGQRYRPPAVDENAPDLFIPLMGLWSYVLLSCIVLAFKHTFKPDMMSSTLYSACFAWALHWLVARLVLKTLSVQSVAWSELLAYTGYAYVMISLTIIAGFFAGKWGYYMLGAYGSLCMAVFLVKTLKRVVQLEHGYHSGTDQASKYVLLGLAVFQFPFAFVMAYRPV